MTIPQIANLRAILSAAAVQRVDTAMVEAYRFAASEEIHARAAAVLAAEEVALVAECHTLTLRIRRFRIARRGSRVS